MWYSSIGELHGRSRSDPSNGFSWTLRVENMDFEIGTYGPYPFVAHGDGAIDIDDMRIDVSGDIEVYSNINTVLDVYDEDDADDLLRGGNILYTRENKNIGELLSQRREVPKSHRSDVSGNTISEPVGKNNHFSEISQFDFSENAAFNDDLLSDVTLIDQTEIPGSNA